MEKPFKNILWATLLMSIISTVAVIVSFATEFWIISSGVSGEQNKYVSDINYGLIMGTIVRRLQVSSGTEYRLSISCLLGYNVCAWSCLDDETVRTAEIEELYDTGAVKFSCQSTGSRYASGDPNGQIKLQDNSTSVELDEIHHRFINATIWLGTILCLVMSGVFALLTVLITGMNLYYVPLKTFLTIQALYIWHGISGLIALFTLLLWGSMFLTTLTNNVATVDTIMGTISSTGRAALGYSYWLNLIPFLLEGGCIGLLYLRQWLYERKTQDIIPIEVGSNISNLY